MHDQAVDRAVDELGGAGFLDDSRFAERLVEDKQRLERWGRERIERELHRRLVPPEIADRVLEDVGRERELQAALLLLTEKVSPPQGDRERDKAWRLLVRKGYEPELAYEAVKAHGRQAA